LQLRTMILVDEGEGRRCYDIFYAKALAQGFNKGGFAGAHLTVKGKNGGSTFVVYKLLGGATDVGESVDFYLHCWGD